MGKEPIGNQLTNYLYNIYCNNNQNEVDHLEDAHVYLDETNPKSGILCIPSRSYPSILIPFWIYRFDHKSRYSLLYSGLIIIYLSYPIISGLSYRAGNGFTVGYPRMEKICFSSPRRFYRIIFSPERRSKEKVHQTPR